MSNPNASFSKGISVLDDVNDWIPQYIYPSQNGTVLKHTDVKGSPLGGNPVGEIDSNSLSPDNHSTGDGGQAGMGGPGQYWSGHQAWQ